MHAYHLEALQSSVANGVMHRCPLLDVSYFDLTTAFMLDIMHGILEGVIPQLLSMLIRRAVREGRVTLDVLNSRLKETCKNASDRLNLFSAKLLTPTGKITGSASQKWQLFRKTTLTLTPSALWIISLTLFLMCCNNFEHRTTNWHFGITHLHTETIHDSAEEITVVLQNKTIIMNNIKLETLVIVL